MSQQGWSIRAIAKLQGHSPSTISRELLRNSTLGSYANGPAQSLCAQRRV
ncbi:MAG: helix-turn-helix domain-containing protein [Burkholderiaceae bacterium]|nr:helix-turn-helix domain-containing protein [Burkholderiaceae bacterium]